METRKSLGVEEKSSKLAMSNCFNWMGSQSSIINLKKTRNNIEIYIQMGNKRNCLIEGSAAQSGGSLTRF